jgi:hypothetical protein
MRTLFICLSMCGVALPGCERLRTKPSSSPASARTSEPPKTPSPTRPPLVAPASSDSAKQPGAPATEPRSSRGTLTVRVYDTPLELQLDALTVCGGEFKLAGFGVRYVGQMSQNWRSQFQRHVALQKRSVQFGESEMELPMIGTVKVLSGQLIIDEVVNENPSRVKGRIAFTLPGPDGPSSFNGTFEVGIVAK